MLKKLRNLCLALFAVLASHVQAVDQEVPSLTEARDVMKQLASQTEPLRRDALNLMEQKEIKVHRDLAYSAIDGVDPARQSLDIYEPGSGSDDERGLPMVLYVHGGAWIAGDKDLALYKPLAFVPDGFVFASTNYRFRPEASLIEMAQSVADAAGWLTRNASDYGADSQRIFLIGHSAGAHLVSLLGTNTSFLTNAGVPIAAIRGVVSLDTAVYDLPKLVNSPTGKFQASVFKGNESYFTMASPWHHVSEDTAHPPFLIFYSDGRPDAITQTIPFGERLRSAGHTATVMEAKGRDHGAIDLKIGTEGDKSTAEIRAFLQKFQGSGPGARSN